MSISELCVRRPVTTSMVYILICVVAGVFVPKLGIALFPSTTFPIVSVSTKYTNVGPEEIDENVTKPLVNRLSSVSGLKKISSSSKSGQSNITLEFAYNRDMEDALQDVQTIASQSVRSLPDNCDAPIALKFDSNSRAFMRLAVKGNLEVHELKTIAEDTIQPLLERVEGVASSSVFGGAARQIRVDLAGEDLTTYNLSIRDIGSVLSGRNVQRSAGTIKIAGIEYEIMTDYYYVSLDEIRETPLTTYSDGTVLHLGDVAQVYEDYDNKSRKVYINGVPGLYMSVSNESDANIAKIAHTIRNNLDAINAALPAGVSLEIISDDTTMIDSAMKEVYASACQGVILAMAIIFLFLRQIKSSIIIGMAIPISVLITLMVMALMDLTINLMTMSGLILALGMTVDSSIVILENIQNYRIKGEKAAISAILGSRNMLNAIVASTLTTLCVFLPMLIYKTELEELGAMFYELVVTVCVAMIASLFVAVTLVPALCGSILRLDTRTQKPLTNPLLKKLDYSVEAALQTATFVYQRSLRWALKNRFICLTAVALAVALSVFTFCNMGLNLQSQSEADDMVLISVVHPIGTENDIVLNTLFQWQDIIEKEIGKDNYKNVILDSGTSNTGSIQINLPPLQEQTISSSRVKELLTPYLKMWPGCNVTFSMGRRMGRSSGGVDIEIISDDTASSTQVATSLVDLLKSSMPQLENVDTDLENGAPKYDLVINTEAQARYAVTTDTIATVLKNAITGYTPTVYYEGGDEYDIIVAVPQSQLAQTDDILALPVKTNAGYLTLDNFVSLRQGRSPQKIMRENKLRLNHVTASIKKGYLVTDVEKALEECVLSNIALPNSVQIAFAGDAQDVHKFGKSFISVIILALFLVFIIMAAQFESLIDPFIIFASIPPMLIGTVLVYKITGQSFSLYSVVGIVALVGIVVNNGIVLVDYTNQLVHKKMNVLDAVLEAASSRFRPIWMTTLTTVLGMVPMGFFPGEGGEQMQPIGLTITGGLTSAAILTLYVAPILYSVFNTRREKRFDNPESLQNQLTQLDMQQVKII